MLGKRNEREYSECGKEQQDLVYGERKQTTRSNSNNLFLIIILLSCATSTLYVLLQNHGGSEVIDNLLEYALPKFKDPDLGAKIDELVHRRGFAFERYDVVTDDGYIIELHRVYSREFENQKRPPVVIALPLFCSSAIFVMDYRNNTISFILADQGFDVWLTNGRGNRYGRRHTKLDPVADKGKFYDYDFIDIGEHDLSKQIDFVIEKTNVQKVFLIGYSQGASSTFALLAKRPEYNDKIDKMVTFGGLRSICYATSLQVKIAAALASPIADILMAVPMLSHLYPSLYPMNELCGRFSWICGKLSVHFGGLLSDHHANITRLPFYMEHMPAGTSLKNLVYYTQTRGAGCDGSVREFDYNRGPFSRILYKLGISPTDNLNRYGTEEAPLLNATNIKVNLKMYWSDGDEFTPEEEVLIMARDLNVPKKHIHRIKDSRFSHFSFALMRRRSDYLYHAIKFFKGEEAPWPHQDGTSP